ncbi:uncharacterized protein [Cherax quadricarinatus]|uniref:uncharacterized protein isoform X2 n=1 Tax=Cherax quadricarinatus TaxID=27406 RepID=UPI00387E2AE3
MKKFVRSSYSLKLKKISLVIEKKEEKKSIQDAAKLEVLSTNFHTLEILSLYTIMIVKRYARDSTFFHTHFPNFIKVIESNLNRLKTEKKWFFATLRDQARLFHNEWDKYLFEINVGRIHYNSHLLMVALMLGLEKIWVSDGCLPLDEEKTISKLKLMFGKDQPVFALKQLSQTDHMFEFLASHSPNLAVLYLPRSDVHSFQSCVKFTSLRVIELAGGVSDKVMCSALWNINKKSDKVLEMAIKESKDPICWQLSLPHLEVLRNNMLQTRGQANTMRLSLGAAALAIQPSLKTVETLQSWDTYTAVLFLLDMEAKQRSTNGSRCNERKLTVTTLTINYHKDLDMIELKRVMNACPMLSHLTVSNAENIHKDLPLLCRIIPMKQVKNLTVDVSKLTNLELTVLLAEMSNLEHLTLELTPQAIVKFNVPIEGETRSAMLPRIKILVIEFISPGVDVWVSPEEINLHAKDIISFLSSFSFVKELYFYNTLLAPAPYLVYGCIGGSLAVLHDLQHLSVISCHEDIPRELSQWPQEITMSNHYKGVPIMLADLQDETTFKHLRALESLEIDEFYINPSIDIMIEALRLSGVKVAVHYRPGMEQNLYNCKSFSIQYIATPSRILIELVQVCLFSQ